MEEKMLNCTKPECSEGCSSHGQKHACSQGKTARDNGEELKIALKDFSRILARSEKFKTLEDLIRGFGHELNNPLTAVIGYTKLLQSIVESEEVQPGVILDYDKDNRVVGVEFLGISSRASQEELSSLQFQTA